MTFLPDLLNIEMMLSFIQNYGYFFIFILMVLEGPTVTAAAAFAASLGFFSIFVIILISILADLFADIIYFIIGKKAAKPFLSKYGKYFFLNEEKINKINEIINNNLAKAIIAVKITPGLAAPGLIMIGSSKPLFRKYILTCLSFIIPSSLIFAGIGYFFGFTFKTFTKYIGMGKEIILLVFFLVVLFFVLKHFYVKLLEKIGKKLK